MFGIKTVGMYFMKTLEWGTLGMVILLWWRCIYIWLYSGMTTHSWHSWCADMIAMVWARVGMTS